MEYLVFFIALALCGVLAFLKGMWDERRLEKWQKKKFREGFGQPSSRAYEDGEQEALTRYWQLHRGECYIDDITANDLSLDTLFSRMNITSSSAGQEYLYYLLRSPSFSQEELAGREALIQYFTQEENTRVALQFLYWKMGRTRKYSIYDYLDFLDGLGQRKNGRHILGILLFIPVLLLIAFFTGWGIAALFLLIGWNIAGYLREKQEIEPYLVSFGYVFRCLELTRKVVDMRVPALEWETKRLHALLQKFGKLKRSGHFGMRAMGDGGNPLAVVSDYINMVLHLDLIGFNIMLHELRARREDIDEMLGLTGRIEALIAVASYRHSLPQWCVPNLKAGVCCRMEGFYHPLLQNAVVNDITAQRGVLVTGSNASGKSTFLKAVALNAILAQTIHTCAAQCYEADFYRVFSSMALRDDLEGADSYYIVEIKSLKRILDAVKQEGAPVLCFVDEVLRGTNTVERIAASVQILKSLCGSHVICFAATHDIELTELLEKDFDNYHFEERIEDGDIFFPYRLMPGRAMTRNAIRLLSIMGYGEDIIENAEALAARFVESGSWGLESGCSR